MKAGTVSIVGRPNAGKSTLLNAVLKTDLAIVTPKAQTTRYQTRGIHAEPDRGQMVFVDTPGIHRAKEGGLNEAMVEESRRALEAPDLIWYVVDPSSGIEHERVVIERLAEAGSPIVVLYNKGDLNPAHDLFKQALEKALREAGCAVSAVFEISAKTGEGLERLLEHSWGALPDGEPLYPLEDDALSDKPTRFFVAELIREQLFLKLEEEVPYGCAVEVERFDEKTRPIRIEAVIHVERESQKGIVIGKGAEKLKKIGSAARKKIEALIGEKVFLGLKVKVYKDWSKDPQALKRLGFRPSR